MGAVWETVGGATNRETRWRRYASGLRLPGMSARFGCRVQVPGRLTPQFDDARTVSVGPVHGEFGTPWAALEAGEPFGQVAGM